MAMAALHYDAATPLVTRARRMLRRRRPFATKLQGPRALSGASLNEAAMALARLWNSRRQP